jgi:GNAT superfamily N-acetyltransferase
MTLTAQLETLASGLLEEVGPLLAEHHQRLGLFRERMPLDPNWTLYLAAEAMGELVIATLRDDGRLIGYYATFLRPGSLHYRRTPTAAQDVMWVGLEARRQGGGRMLLDLIEAEIARRCGPAGALMIANSKIGSPDHDGLDALFRGRDYAPSDLYYAKWIGG